MSLSRIGSFASRNRRFCRFYFSSSFSLASRHLTRCCDDERFLKDSSDALSRPSFRFSLIRTQQNGFSLTPQYGDRYFSSESSTQSIIGMPALSPTMTQGNISQWKKREGDKIEPGDVLCIIETDKASLEFESLEEGYLAKILLPDGTKDVPVGQAIAITVEEADEIAKVSSPSPSLKADNDENNTRLETVSTTVPSNLPTHLVISMPALSPTMNQGNIARWRKKEGDKIEVGDVICEIETDKATLEFESLEEGFLAKIVTPDGSKDVAVGQAIAVTVEDPNDIDVVKSSFSAATGAKQKQPTTQQEAESKPTKSATFSRISPAAKLLLLEHGLPSSQFEATGAHNTLLKSDVLSAIKSGKFSKPSKPKSQEIPQSPAVSPSVSKIQETASFQDVPNSQIRKIIAKRLIESKQTTPHLYLSTDVTIDPLLAFRKELIEKHNVKVSVNDVVIKAVALALRNVSKANAFWDNDKGEIILCDSVDIAVAVATDSGLITPIVRNADEKSISSISLEVKQLAEKARAGKLAPHEFQGGSFTISNLGMYPVDHFSAIINPPQAGILAVGRGNKTVEPVVGVDGSETPTVVNKMRLTLSADHRVFLGDVGGAFLSSVRNNFSDIRRLLL